MRTVAIVQARMGSTRLPGKVLRILCGKTVLWHVITRVKACSLIDEVIVATTNSTTDNIIADRCHEYGVKVFRGSEDDVLSRYYYAARNGGANIVIRITSDCPLIDPYLLGSMLHEFLKARKQGINLDYMSNSFYPRGLDVEIFMFSALEKAFLEADKQAEREHVTPYIYRHPGLFFLRRFCSDVDLSKHRWTLDTEDDFKLINEIYMALYTNSIPFDSQAVLNLFSEKPGMMNINAHVKQKELNLPKSRYKVVLMTNFH